MKKSNLFCVSKKYFFIFLLALVFILYLISSSYIIKNKNVTQSKAAQHEIIGGSNVISGEYPAVALIRTRTIDFTEDCTGTLIAPRWILTAAHCLYSEGETRVAVGIIDQKKFDTSSLNSVFNIPHPEFKSKGVDIGLILLDHEITNVPLPKLPKATISSDIYKKGNNVTVVGWGCTGFEPTLAPSSEPIPIFVNSLQKMSLPIYTKMTVVNILKSEFEIGYDDYRAGEKNVCFGDSGGPSFYKKNNDLYLIGITVSNELLRPFAATNVMVRTNWINAQISKYTSLYPTSIPTLIPTVTPIPPTLIPTLIPTITPVPTSAEKPYCTGNNRFCSGLNKCEDYLGGVYHENKNYKCNYNNKCCERSNITPTLNKIN